MGPRYFWVADTFGYPVLPVSRYFQVAPTFGWISKRL